jgi:hypothetical protein
MVAGTNGGDGKIFSLNGLVKDNCHPAPSRAADSVKIRETPA